MQAACKLGFPVLYGDGSRPVVLQTAGISSPKAVMVMYTGRQKSVQSVDRLRQAFPHVWQSTFPHPYQLLVWLSDSNESVHASQVPIYARAQDLGHLFELKQAGITDCILENAEVSKTPKYVVCFSINYDRDLILDLVPQTSLQLGSVLLRGLGVMSDDVRFLRRMMRESMELRAQETVERKDGRETDWLVAFQVRIEVPLTQVFF